MRRSRWRVGLGAAAAFVAALVVVAPLFMKANPRLLPTRTPADVGLAFEDVTFSPPDLPLKLKGWLMPAASSKATIVVVHGGGEDNRSIPYGKGLELMHDLVVHGYSVMAIDLRNFGESDASPDGKATFGVTEAADVVGAVDFLKKRDASTRIAALGFSMGGSTVIYAAARDPRIEAVVTDSAFAESRAITANFVKAAMGIPPWLSAPLLWSAEHIHGAPLSAGRAIDVVGGIAPRPLLVIQDASDPIVPLEQGRALAAACPGAELWVTDYASRATGPFGTHIHAYEFGPDAWVARVTGFLDRTFAAR